MTNPPSVLNVKQIDAVLPQTQCKKCGFDGCFPYAESMAKGESINRCSPGGEQLIHTLAGLLDRKALPLHVDCQPEGMPHTVTIREAECIGCTKCIQACPMDAIVGAAKQMHTVLTDDCTGCDLCIAPCPTDCIDSVPLRAFDAEALLSPERQAHNRVLYQQHQERQVKQIKSKAVSRQQKSVAAQQIKRLEVGKGTPADNSHLVLNALQAQKRKLQRQLQAAKEAGAKNQLAQVIAILEEKMQHMQRRSESVVTAIKIKQTQAVLVQKAVLKGQLKKLERQLSLACLSGDSQEKQETLTQQVELLRAQINTLAKASSITG